VAFQAGSLVSARGREWVVLPDSTDDFLVLRPLGGTDDDVAAVLPTIEQVTAASFPPPRPDDLGDQISAGLLRSALRIGFRSTVGPFRNLAGLAVEPRAYQLVPLLMALRQETVRILISDDVGIGKTVEAGLIAAELLALGDARGLTVLCSPALAEQWSRELREKFGLDAELVLPSTARRLERTLIGDESIFQRYPVTVVSTDFIKSDRRRHEFLRTCPDLVIVDEAHTAVADGGPGGKARTHRYDLVRDLAGDERRHLILVTATPHSGKEEAFATCWACSIPRSPPSTSTAPTDARCSPNTSSSAAAPTSAATSTRTPRSPRTARPRKSPTRCPRYTRRSSTRSSTTRAVRSAPTAPACRNECPTGRPSPCYAPSPRRRGPPHRRSAPAQPRPIPPKKPTRSDAR